MKALKILGIVVGVIVVLIIAGVVALFTLVDPNDYKEPLAQYIEQQTGRRVDFQGDLSLSIYPKLGVELGPLTVSNAPGFGDKPMVEVRHAVVGVELIPLFSKQLRVDEVVVDGLVARLAKDKSGRTNWDDLTQRGETAPSSAKEVTQPEPSGGGEAGGSMDLSIQGVKVTNATVVWDDAQAGQHYEVSDVNVELGAVELGKPMPVTLSLTLTSADPAMKVMPKLVATVTAQPDVQRYTVADATLDVQAEGKTIPGGSASVSLEIPKAVADMTAGTAQLPAFTLTAYDLRVTGSAEASQLNAEPAFNGKVDIAQFNLKELMRRLGMTPLETRSEEALTKVSAQVGFEGNAKAVQVAPLHVVLDQSSIDATATVGLQPALYKADVQIDQIDADRYMPPKQEGAGAGGEQEGKPEAKPAAEKAKKDEGVDLTPLRDLNLDAALRIGTLKVANATMQNVRVQAVAKGGVLRVDPVSADLYGGNFRNVAVVDVRGQVPTFQEQVNLQGLQVEPLLKDLNGTSRLAGTAEMHAKLSGSGLGDEAVKRSLSGDGSFALRDGAIVGVNIAKMIRDAFAVLKGKLPVADETQRTDFASLEGTFRIDKGIATNNDLTLKSPLLRMEGKGTVDLPQNTIDYLANTTLVGSIEGQGGLDMSALEGIPVPIRVTGSLDDPKFMLDPKALAEALAKGMLKQPVDQMKGVIEQQQKSLEQNLKNQLLGTPKQGDQTGQTGQTDQSGQPSKPQPEKLLEDAGKSLKNLFK